ncbi:hypothetical protein ETAA8_56280 [Anatilimnocola aggregata]|uniref:Uncharacterized protein n=1 Tax=Anatilimnocola aggregata TaxID=2528021 RepID=A0A517YJT7_9BACT|nr:twin-arginine translocation signal domain-containing protein [Anatilimnocola aggregata]QDU30488.1 hypothetical protein ETAA8_56280 [Anatilimnocola aggregata]
MTHLRQHQSFVPSVPNLFLGCTRRSFLRQSAITAALAAGGLPLYAADEAVMLAVNSNEARPQHVKVAVEASGQMKMNPDSREVKFLPMSVTAELDFLQRRLPAVKDSAAVRLVRNYSTAQTKFNLKNTEFSHSLRDDRRLVVLQAEGDAGTYFSPLGPLSREELELLDVPGAGVLPELLLPGKALKVGETWNLTDAAVVRLLSLDAVHKQDITGKFDELRDGIAILSLEGKASGAVGGVASECAIRAKLNVDPKQQLLTWLALSLNENRAIGHAQPGYDVTSRIRMLTALTDSAAEISEESISKLPLVAKAGETLLSFRSEKGGFELVHDRRWRVMNERYDAAILRMVDRGELVAQCNISKLKSFSKDEKLALDTFQGDVKTALEKQKAQITEASENVNDAGIKVQRLLVAGFASELPIQWTYYHLSDSAGRRASVVFTIDQRLVEKYAHIDQEIIAGCRFFDPPRDDKSEPTPAAAKPKDETAKKPGDKDAR